jgi:SAM-dependent methyltransferase
MAPSLLEFFNNSVLPRLIASDTKVLDIGSGRYSLFETTKLDKKLIEAMDIAHSFEKRSNDGIKYFTGDITQKNSSKNNYYDLVFDSHCLHCLKSKNEQVKAVYNIYDSLVDGGIFASEIMVQPSSKTVFFPDRLIRNSFDLETMLRDCGFNISYFVIMPDMKFYFEHDHNEIECDMLRIIAKK